MNHTLQSDQSDSSIINVDQARQDAFYTGLEEAPIHDRDAFTSDARYANIILPKLRRVAGFADSGAGTWQVDEERQYTADDYGGNLAGHGTGGGGDSRGSSHTFTERPSRVFEQVVDGFWEGVAEGTPDESPYDVEG